MPENTVSTHEAKQRALKLLAEEASNVNEDEIEQLEGQASEPRPKRKYSKRSLEDLSTKATMDGDGSAGKPEAETEIKSDADKENVTSPK